MPRHWFLKTRNGKAGPITSKALVRLVADGKVLPNSGVSADGEHWFKASNISGLPFRKAEPLRYWVKTRSGDAGPFTVPKLVKLAAARRVKPNVMVSCDGKRWVQAIRVAELCFPSHLVSPAPSPQPLTETPVVQTAPSRSVWADIRESEFERRFGSRGSVWECDDSLIAVHVHPASPSRPVTTIVTSGLSDHAMPVTAASASPRAELLIYVDVATPVFIEVLRAIVEHAVRESSSYGYGSFYEHGEPLFADSELDGCIFMISNVPSDDAIRSVVVIDQHPLQMLWVLPTTSLERSLIARHGLRVFCQMMDAGGHGLVFDPSRTCLVKRSKLEV